MICVVFTVATCLHSLTVKEQQLKKLLWSRANEESFENRDTGSWMGCFDCFETPNLARLQKHQGHPLADFGHSNSTEHAIGAGTGPSLSMDPPLPLGSPLALRVLTHVDGQLPFKMIAVLARRLLLLF